MNNNFVKIDAEIKFVKTHDNAKLPQKAHGDDNCYDLFAVEDTTIPGTRTTALSSPHQTGVSVGSAVVPVGIKVGYITPGFGFVIKPKSGLGFKASLQPHLGEIDTGYRGDCAVKMYNFSDTDYSYKAGDKVAQIKVERNWETSVVWTDEVEVAERGEGGFGSTGK